MKIIKYEKNNTINAKTAVALGNFDGLHIGHQKLIETMIKESRIKKLKSSVLLFNNHTKTVLNNVKAPEILTTNEQKTELLESLGLELIYSMDFNAEIMKLSPEEFVKKILIDRLNAKLVVVGFDYKFGYKATGDSEVLKQLGKNYGFEVIIIGPVYSGDNIVSSTLIRDLLKKGKVKEASELLGRPFTMNGKVISGEKRGKSMGFPTANLSIEYNYLIPKFGVYKTKTVVNNKEYLSLTNVGTNPTFDEAKIHIETHILDFNENIYGEKISIKYLDFIREEIKFNTKGELMVQVKNDIKAVKM
ncbi:bifunctional riboflavin kinase/FAD synthetase [Sporanaerobacter acetigenes]|uniref:Riboflavin biosynthesis protein n=1 Tax=Sporanaerobacter acetigenes DSM 13106 TaxID=1123281 RepID=A0A1M5XJU4_9FIRM|nr:bifunctional riboflavin kinase/FAD synthetase [Sporanaerobacter acetigenes]SHI00019.1 riboflavin kinase / FMN adenylyltransferase [Sporanaerobacter acetigenes DSM 13106]